MSTSPDAISRDHIVKALPYAGAMIRYAFYTLGIFIIISVSLIGLPIRPAPVMQVKKVDGPPAFHLAALHLQRLPKTTQILTHRHYGRVEVRQEAFISALRLEE